ncbi:MAG TPA: DUF4190 domain-containing protein [Pyrinomonadaceae bacterium]|nr:DUF4190 domain-containing protein [Pyrinomonadaceae bacterium]
MKYCPVCKRKFDEPWLSFCSDDGTPLIQELTPSADPNWDPRIREPKVKTPDEQETKWLPREPPVAGGWIAPDERAPMSPGPWQPPPAPSPYPSTTQPNQSLALASLITAVAGFLLAGCMGPIPAIVAVVLGLVALSQIKKSPEKYTGKPFATAGVIIGAIIIAFYAIFFLWVILAGVLR